MERDFEQRHRRHPRIFLDVEVTMKTIGLIGGMSWESTVTYYQVINETVKAQLGGLHSAKCLLMSVDFAEIEAQQAAGEWDKSGEALADAASRLEQAGADFIVICTNTMHKVVPAIEAAIGIPVLHIADATADELVKDGVKTVALLGTKYTMTQRFYRSRLERRGISVLIPDAPDIETVNSVIYDELCRGIISEESRVQYLHIIESLAKKGVQGAVLGCTEIGLLVRQSDTALPLYDTTMIHAIKAAMASLGSI
jgi:aspartate racemase